MNNIYVTCLLYFNEISKTLMYKTDQRVSSNIALKGSYTFLKKFQHVRGSKLNK